MLVNGATNGGFIIGTNPNIKANISYRDAFGISHMGSDVTTDREILKFLGVYRVTGILAIGLGLGCLSPEQTRITKAHLK